jgi:hypothetical protein
MKLKDKSFNISFIVGLSFTSLGLGLTLLGWADLGMAFFFFLPLAVGISSGLLPDLKEAIIGTISSLFIFSLFLVVTKAEGIICVIMALPILLLAMWIGWLIGRAIRSKKGEVHLKSTIAPVFIFLIVNILEIFSGNPSVPSSASTSIVLNATPESVYNSIIEVDTVDVETNFLQKIGLPTPRKCVLSEAKVGGTRLCEFEEGLILETIKEITPNKYLRMEVTECKLDRERHWLKFNEDIYNIESVDNRQTKITRTTTYSSTLKPRLYWELMEGLTIKTEHDFVFRNLKKDVEN